MSLFIGIECIEYQDAVNERVYSSVGLSGPPIEQTIFRCSIATVPLIVGGEHALAKEFPHMVLITIYYTEKKIMI